MTQHNRNLRKRTGRRGVTLLLVLGLMTMFAMLVVTFMVVTTQALRTSEITAETLINPKSGSGASSSAVNVMSTPDFESAIKYLLVGSMDNVIGPHGILENLYGHPMHANTDSLGGTFSTVTANARGTYLSTTVTNLKIDNTVSNTYLLGDLCGHVLTVTDATTGTDGEKLKNKSTIILKYDYSGTDGVVRFAPFDVPSLSPVAQATALSGCSFIINSPAFSGTGPGYYYDPSSPNNPRLVGRDEGVTTTEGDPDFGALDATVTTGELLALRSNILAPENDGTQPYKTYLENNLVLMNPDYTAPDYMNMFLAWNEIAPNSLATDAFYEVKKVIPSFHRPDLLRYRFQSDLTGSGVNLEELRKFVLRPLQADHPEFSGSNVAAFESANSPTAIVRKQAYFLLNGPWDVDNDGDGIQDGIWLDLGLPTETHDGRFYKQLVSFYVLDLDGRLNVNAMGNLAHAEADFASASTSGFADKSKFGSLADVRGGGSGLAEVRLDEGLKVAAGTVAAQKLMQSGNSEKAGRYGMDGAPGQAGDSDTSVLNGDPVNNPSKVMRSMGVFPHNFSITFGDSEQLKGYGGIFPDFWGTAALLFDPLGNRAENYISGVDLYYAKNPYLFNPYADDDDDRPFKLNDLEFLIRSVGDKNFLDVLDATRLRHLFQDAGGSKLDKPDKPHKFSKFRQLVTTRSSDIPVMPRFGIGTYKGFYEYLVFEICDGKNAADEAALTEAKTKAVRLANFLPQELLRGEKVNLDRIAFLESGNLTKKELLKQKAKFAQEIFYLLLVLCYEELNGYTEGSLSNQDVIARLAQWSVNLVDFLDTDDVMTPFVYSEDPFNHLESADASAKPIIFDNAPFITWIVDNQPTKPNTETKVHVLWGMEQPEIALTKTLGIHNRRVADSKYGFDVAPGEEARGPHVHENDPQPPCNGKHLNRIAKECAAATCEHKHDTSFDQVMVPQGSLFLELYRAGDPGRSNYTNDLHDGNLLNLAKTTAGNYPVWRLAIGKRAKKDLSGIETADNDVFEKAKTVADAGRYSFQPPTWTGPPDANADCKVELERFIWFGNTIPAETSTCSYRNFGSPTNAGTTDNVKLAPNEYLVIGPRVFTSFLSKRVKDTESDEGEGEGEGGDTETFVKRFGVPSTESRSSIDLRRLGPVDSGDALEVPEADPITSSKSPKVMIAAAPVATGWENHLGQGLGSGIGVSVSEPLPDGTYYTPPTGKASDEMKQYMGVESLNDSYIISYDDATVAPECNTVTNKELDETKGFGTLTRYRTVFLQRLADPNREFNAETNPYITVDWNVIDLHVINSEEDADGLEPRKINDDSMAYDGALHFTMRQWGYSATRRQKNERPNLWDRAFDTTMIDNASGFAGLKVTPLEAPDENDPDPEESDPSKPRFRKDMVLGRFSNVHLDGHKDNINDPNHIRWKSTEVINGLEDYLGAPRIAFLHFPWNNGPLSNSNDLMLVPACSNSRFGFEFHAPATVSLSQSWWTDVPSLGSKSVSGKQMPICNPVTILGPYLNFFHRATSTTKSLELARLFEYVRVPSRYNGTIRGFSEETTGGGTYYEPIYEMREPGKINLNTLNEASWTALSKMGSGNSLVYADFQKLVQIDPASPPTDPLPTTFNRPFRSPWAGKLVPPLDAGTLVRTEPLEMTMFRKKDPTGTNPEGIFLPHNPEPLFAGGDKGTNMLTALEDVLRRSDTVTNRSNVFAVWVTIGYFEAKKYEGNTRASDLRNDYPGLLSHISDNDVFDAIYPDGIVLRKEKGVEDATVTRHRTFYVIDRTVPVGFRRGGQSANNEDLNFREVIVHSRRLE